MNNTQTHGNSVELSCMAYLQKLGCNISIPFGNLRYDFIIDFKNKLYRIQCKSAQPYADNSSFFIYLTSGNKNRVKSYSDDEIDFFCTFFENKCYLIPKQGLTVKSITLRLLPPKNKQSKIHLASDYEAEKILCI